MKTTITILTLFICSLGYGQNPKCMIICEGDSIQFISPFPIDKYMRNVIIGVDDIVYGDFYQDSPTVPYDHIVHLKRDKLYIYNSDEELLLYKYDTLYFLQRDKHDIKHK